MTIVCAGFAYFLVADFPEEARWLSDDERAFVQARLAEDAGDSNLDAKTTWRDVIGVFKDSKIIIGGFVYFGIIVSGYGYAYFSPSIILSLGYSPVMTQLYSVPPWAATFTMSMLVAAASDYYKKRFIFILPLMFVGATGLIVLLTVHDNVKVRYGSLFLVAVGGFAAIPVVICWLSTNRECISVCCSNSIT